MTFPGRGEPSNQPDESGNDMARPWNGRTAGTVSGRYVRLAW